ncbi:MAG: ABC transporter permease, partial [Desulfobacula sp.]|nr:ABC transporter permease [Desulfobacula sp.]
MEDIIISTLQRAMVAGTPLLLATTGEVICERSGILNLGVEGVMAIGAVVAFIVTMTTGQPWLGVLVALAAGMAISIIHAFSSVTLQANQVVSGLALTMLGLGLSGMLGKPYVGKPLSIKMDDWVIPYLSDIPWLGKILFMQSPFFYLAIVLAFASWFFLERTRLGIQIRSTGENPKATETQGVNVTRLRYLSVIIGGGFSGLAGAHLSISYSKSWIEGMTAGRGWIAIA